MQREDDPAGGEDRDWSTAGAPALIAHILARYHAVHRQQLPELIRLSRKVEQTHAQHADCPAGLADHLIVMSQELESHMRKEEDILFPMLTRRMGARAQMPIRVMRAEHDEHRAELRRLEALTGGITPPQDACSTWQALYQGLAAFRQDLITHIHLENDILFEDASRSASKQSASV